jgi:hypothetical protein
MCQSLILFVDLCDFSNEDGTPSISLCPLTSSLHMSCSTPIFAYSQYSIRDIPSMLNVVDCFQVMSFTTHANSKLRDLNYDNFHLNNVCCISTTFNGDVLFELPPIVNLDSHFRQMQGMDKKHDGHAWRKVKMTNIKNDFNLTFWRVHYLGHLQCRNDGCDLFFLNKCKNKTTWIGIIIHDLRGGYFASGPPFCKICNSAFFYVNMCVAHMYYVVHE